MLAPHFSPQQQKIPALTPRQISHLKRYPCCHISSHSSRNRHLSPSRTSVPLQAGDALTQSAAIRIRVSRQYDLRAVFATSKGLTPAACQHLTRWQHLMVRGKGRSGQAGLSPAGGLGSNPGERVVQLHPRNISTLPVNALWNHYSSKKEHRIYFISAVNSR